ncbi:alpha/beta fold hydrolase [Propioniciclava sp. MC1595]|uniref:alpha/beta fold hydrolase n=1 Tax=Propioniciclava sp. MC1595 TaxID=2760308 RepID=UPI0016626383|nr:alpha/beta hydrolase [Propioniciclava sp. MC1595]MBB1494205.1 alpha/beta fold hydrolase [Propioniciclava sp. MC1595]QTE25187.1 alpha/beta fold hydrolase [Propioniciclava sp. MC1595]
MRLLALLHGLGQTPQSWQDQVTAMPAGFKAVAPWLRGLRPGRAQEFSVEGAADDVLALLNQHGVEQMSLVGVSLGAMVALDAAIRSPETVSHLVLAAGQVNPPKSVMRMQRLVFSMVPAKRLASMGVEKRRFLQALDQAATIDYRSRLGQVTARTLVVVGADDKANLTAARDLAAGIPGARLEVIPGVGHQPNVEDPAAFNALVWPFLADEA